MRAHTPFTRYVRLPVDYDLRHTVGRPTVGPSVLDGYCPYRTTTIAFARYLTGRTRRLWAFHRFTRLFPPTPHALPTPTLHGCVTYYNAPTCRATTPYRDLLTTTIYGSSLRPVRVVRWFHGTRLHLPLAQLHGLRYRCVTRRHAQHGLLHTRLPVHTLGCLPFTPRCRLPAALPTFPDQSISSLVHCLRRRGFARCRRL